MERDETTLSQIKTELTELGQRLAQAEQKALEMRRVENAWLLESEREQRQLAEAMHQVGLTLGSTLDPDAVLDQLLEQMASVIPYDTACVMLIERGRAFVTRTRGFEQFDPEFRQQLAHLEFQLDQAVNLRYIVETGNPFIMTDTWAEPTWIRFPGLEHIRSWIGAPIVVQGQIVGVLSLDSTRLGFYQSSHLRLLASFAAQAALALQNARLFEAEARRRQEVETLWSAAQVLSNALELREVFDLILQELEKVVPYDSASVQQLEGSYSRIIGGRGFPNPEQIIGLKFDITGTDNPNRDVVLLKSPLILDDASAKYAEFRRDPHVPAQIHSWLGVPLLFGDRLIGMLSLDKREAGFYTEAHARLATAFAAQAAVAIENARLFEAERKQLALAQTLQQVGALLTTRLTLEQVFERIFDLLARVIDYDTVAIHSVGDDGRLYLGAARGFPDRAVVKAFVDIYGQEMIREDWIYGGVLVISDTEAADRWIHVPGLEHIRSWIGAAMFVRDHLVGILNVDSKTPNAYDQAAGVTVAAFANQAAIAIENSSLYAQAQREIEERMRVEASLRQSQEALCASEAQYRTTLDAIRDIIHVVDADLRIVLANKELARWRQMWGIDVTAVGQDLFQVFPFLPERVRQEYLQIFEQGQLLATEEATIVSDEVRYTETLKIPIFEGAQVVRVATVVRDVTERKRLEAQFRQAQKMEIFGRLAGGVAHDFNNMLTAIMGYSELVLDGLSESDPSFDELSEIRRVSERAAELTKQLLVFSRKQDVESRTVAVNDIVANVERMLLRLIGEDVGLTTDLEPQAGYIEADQGQIEQVLLNLAVNARDAMPQGGRLSIRTENIELDRAYTSRHVNVPPGSYILILVSDTGIGMSEEVQRRLFEPFFTTKEPGKGTGLGLATVYWIVQQHSGHVDVKSSLGKGTTFYLYFPRVQPSALIRPETLGELVEPGTETILLVEDEELVRNLAKRILLHSGYHVLAARNGYEAIDLAHTYSEHIDLLLTDVVMPGMSGRELAEQILTLCPEIKVLYMSGHTDDAIIHHGVQRSELAFLQKPFSLHSLAARVHEVLSSTQ
ncbi:MAG: GAF domain-containing protein [Anaerolineae bacterium]|nr:GAF domain-containing protein [Anaerolineae bacterium]